MTGEQITQLTEEGYKIAEKTWPISIAEFDEMLKAGKLRTILGKVPKAERLQSLFEMDPAEAFDIDDELDFRQAELLLEAR